MGKADEGMRIDTDDHESGSPLGDSNEMGSGKNRSAKKAIGSCGLILILVVLLHAACWLWLPGEDLFYLLYGVPVVSYINLDGILYSIPDEEKAAIYISLIADIHDNDHDRTTLPGYGSFYIIADEGTTPSIRMEIEAYFSDYAVSIQWINDESEAPREECCTGTILDGAIIVLNEINFPGKTSAYSRIYTFVHDLYVREAVYHLEKMDGEWEISGDPVLTIISGYIQPGMYLRQQLASGKRSY